MSADRAEQRLQQALRERDARDPRDYYRTQLRQLKQADEGRYRRGAAYYEETLIPRVADEDSDPLAEWLEYGRVLAALTADGETVQIDPSGRSTPYKRPIPAENMVLHLPTSVREPAITVGIPQELSPAQRATYDLLVKQRVSH